MLGAALALWPAVTGAVSAIYGANPPPLTWLTRVTRGTTLGLAFPGLGGLIHAAVLARRRRGGTRAGDHG